MLKKTHEHLHKQLEVKPNQPSLLCGNRNGHHNTLYISLEYNQCTYLFDFATFSTTLITPLLLYWNFASNEYSHDFTAVYHETCSSTTNIVVFLFHPRPPITEKHV